MEQNYSKRAVQHQTADGEPGGSGDRTPHSPILQKGRRKRLRSESEESEDERPRKTRRYASGFSAEDLAKIIASLQGNSSKNISTTNVIPEFDPNNKSQNVERWIKKVNECTVIYGWDEKQTIHYALQKLTGLAKRWYESLPTLAYSWVEWQEKLKKAFPCDENYGKQLEEMLNRKSRTDESYRDYFYEKVALINRCEIVGRKAVDCLIYGISDISVRNGAQALKCNEPEDLLNYLASQQPPQAKEYSRAPQIQFKRRDNRNNGAFRNYQNSNKSNNENTFCFNCEEKGHYYKNCSKPLVKCSKCGRVGHNSDGCNKKPLISYEVKSSNSQNTDKKILKICINDSLQTQSDDLITPKFDTEKSTVLGDCSGPDTNKKYFKNISVNGTQMQAYVDFGSDCTLMKISEARKLFLDESTDSLPVIRGFGDSMIKPKFRSKINIKIDDVETEINVLAVDDKYLQTSLLIGQNLTELSNVTVLKNKENLFFYYTPTNNETSVNNHTLNLYIDSDVTISKGGLIEVRTSDNYSGDIYIDGSTRSSPSNEYHLHQGCFKLENGKGIVFVTALTMNPVILKENTLIARASPAIETKTWKINSDIQKEVLPLEETQIKVGSNVDDSTRTRLYELLQKYRSCFATNLSELGCTNTAKMSIELQDKTPVVYRPYRLPYSERDKVREMVNELIDNDIVQESESNYASPILLVKKKNGESRLCVDFRALNSKTIKDKYPLPLIDDQISNLSGNKFFITLDLASGYYQIPMEESSRHLTAFVTPDGHYEFKRMPFGLANAPAVFQKMMNKLLGARRFTSALAYMDDLLIPSATIEEGFQRLEDVLQLIQSAGLTLKLSKCSFFNEKIEYLGYEISADGIKPSEKKIMAVKDFPVPRNVHEVRQFLGLSSYFRRFVKGFGEIARPLNRLLKKDITWQWGNDEGQSFKQLKDKLIQRPILALYDPKLDTELHTDASSLGLGGILVQWQSNPRALKPVAYYSRQTTAEERFFHSYELETLAVVCSLKKFRPYLLGLQFIVFTDCNALRTTLTKRDLIPRIARWWLQISEYNFTIEYRPGANMSHVDALSRNPLITNQNDEGITGDEEVVKTLSISTDNWILSLQMADPELLRITRILKPDLQEDVAEIKKNFTVKNHALQRKVGEQLRLVVPKNARWQICKANHDEIGHLGFAKTLERIQNKYWFPKLRRFVKKYVASCIDCAYNKDNAAKTRSGHLHPIEKVEKPFHTLHLDHLGPFVRSKQGNNYILTIVDGFTKYLFARPVKDTKTKNVIKVLENLFNDFATPNRIISDRGTAFTSAQFKDFCINRGIKHVLNAVACPRANGQAERFNQTILASLSTQNYGQDERIWEQQLGKVQWGIINTINSTTKKTASEMLFGIKMNNVTDNKLQSVENNEVNSVNNDTVPLTQTIDKIRHEAAENIKLSQQKQKETYDKNRVPFPQYSVGDLIKITKTNFHNDGKSKKLLPKFIGPYKIVKCLGNDRYAISNVPGFNTKRYESVVSADRIRPWINIQALEIDKSSGSENCTDSESNSDMEEK